MSQDLAFEGIHREGFGVCTIAQMESTRVDIAVQKGRSVSLSGPLHCNDKRPWYTENRQWASLTLPKRYRMLLNVFNQAQMSLSISEVRIEEN
jgi:hypothetical protein